MCQMPPSIHLRHPVADYFSNQAVFLLRMIASAEIKWRAEFFAPFIMVGGVIMAGGGACGEWGLGLPPGCHRGTATEPHRPRHEVAAMW